jgi:site-specific DNA-methyltransferase (adenine-specific)
LNDLDKEFHFTLDPCPLYGGVEVDGLEISWKGERVFVNPPYGPKIRAFMEKAQEADLAVFLIPARTDTKWFHEIVLPKAKEIRFIQGRLKFGGSKNSAPFPSMIIVFDNRKLEERGCVRK